VPIVTVSVVAEAAVKVHVDSDGNPEQLKVGGCANPPRRPKVIVPEPLWPGEETLILRLLGLRVKSWMFSAEAAEVEAAKVVSPG